MSNDKIVLEAYALDIPIFDELWKDIREGMIKNGASKNEIKAGELCAFGIYNKFLGSIREQLSREN